MQVEMFYEDENDVLRATIQALGGFKTVGHRLWPDKTPDKAGEHLSNALNPSHLQKLSFSEGCTIIEWGRDENVHIAMAYLSNRWHYTPPQPIKPEDQKSQLQRDFIDAVNIVKGLSKQLESFE